MLSTPFNLDAKAALARYWTMTFRIREGRAEIVHIARSLGNYWNRWSHAALKFRWMRSVKAFKPSGGNASPAVVIAANGLAPKMCVDVIWVYASMAARSRTGRIVRM